MPTATPIEAAGSFTYRNEEISRWVDNVLSPSFRHFAADKGWSPAVNIYEDAACYYVVVDLAGVHTDEVDLSVENGKLVLIGQRPAPTPEPAHGPVRMRVMEIDHGRFRRALELPPNVDIDAVGATYKCGFLSIQLPKRG